MRIYVGARRSVWHRQNHTSQATSVKFHTHERPLTMGEIDALSTQGRILEVFVGGTAVIVAPVSMIAWKGKDIVLPVQENGFGVVGWRMIVDMSTGNVPLEGLEDCVIREEGLYRIAH